MNNESFFRITAAEHLGYIKGAVQARAERFKNGAPTLRDQVRHLANCCGAYLVGSSTLGCYKFGYGASLRNGIGSHVYPFKLDVILWCETDEGRELAEQLRSLFRTKSCKVNDTSGEWFKLNEEDLETLRTKFQFVTDLVGGTSGQGYLNLRGRSKDESRDLLFDFRFLTDKEAEESKKDVYWFRVGDVLDLKSQFQVNNYLIKNGLMKEDEAKAQFANETLFKLWSVIHESRVINYFLEEDEHLDKVLNIFIRVKETLIKLSAFHKRSS